MEQSVGKSAGERGTLEGADSDRSLQLAVALFYAKYSGRSRCSLRKS